MTGYKYQINYRGSSKVIHRIVDRLNHLMETILGTTHDTAFYGDLGQIAYDHSQEIGNAHQMTADDIDLGDIRRRVDTLGDAIGVQSYWVDHEEDDDGPISFVDHDGDELQFHDEANLLGWH